MATFPANSEPIQAKRLENYEEELTLSPNQSSAVDAKESLKEKSWKVAKMAGGVVLLAAGVYLAQAAEIIPYGNP